MRPDDKDALMMNGETGKWIIIAGAFVMVTGVIIYFFHDKLHWIGNLPGDIRIDKGNVKVYFPLTTMIIISLIINLLIRIFR